MFIPFPHAVATHPSGIISVTPQTAKEVCFECGSGALTQITASSTGLWVMLFMPLEQLGQCTSLYDKQILEASGDNSSDGMFWYCLTESLIMHITSWVAVKQRMSCKLAMEITEVWILHANSEKWDLGIIICNGNVHWLNCNGIQDWLRYLISISIWEA